MKPNGCLARLAHQVDRESIFGAEVTALAFFGTRRGALWEAGRPFRARYWHQRRDLVITRAESRAFGHTSPEPDLLR